MGDAREGVAAPRDGSRQQGQFQDILLAAQRESASRRAPRQHEMDRGDESDGKQGDSPDAPLPDRRQAEELPLFAMCEQMATVCAQCNIMMSAALYKCTKCVTECGGLLSVPEKELHSWGVRDNEELARDRQPRAEDQAYRARAQTRARVDQKRAQLARAQSQGLARPNVV